MTISRSSTVEQIDGLDDWADLISSTFVPLECHGGADAFRGVLRSTAVGDLQLTRITASSHRVARTRRTIARNDPGTYKVGLQLQGTAHLTQDGREATLDPGDLAVYDTSRPYTLAFDPGASVEMFVLMFPGDLLAVPGASMAQVTATRIAGGEGLGALVSPFLSRLADTVSAIEPLVSSRLARNVLDLLETVFRDRLDLVSADSPSLQSSRLLALKAWIARHLDQPDLTPEMVAAANHLSVRYLHRLFEQDGTTVSRWTKERRLEGCRRELADPSLVRFTVAAIAARWGMLDAATFSRAFREAFGESPRAHRARHALPVGPPAASGRRAAGC